MATVEVRTDFFDTLFANDQGYLCLAITKPPARRDTFKEHYFEWPAEREKIDEFLERMSPTHNVYFCVNILSQKKRVKANAIPQNLVWADLDTCSPSKLDIPPQVVIESSPNRYQAIWRVDQKLDPYTAENYSRRIAYQYANEGADKSGHDLTQLLRVPGSFNFKYELAQDVPVVRLRTNIETLLPVALFDALPVGDEAPYEEVVGMPELDTLPTSETVIYAYSDHLKQTAFLRYYSEEPEAGADWSKVLWRCINTCLDVGMTEIETFAVVLDAKCNKYKRDGRPVSHLWREVVKASYNNKSIQQILGNTNILTMPALLSAEQESQLTGTIIDDYKAWAVTVTDAVPEYHELACAIILSSVMSKTLRLHSNLPFKLVPNLWGMVLGDSTLTRKTTAMDMAMDFVRDCDDEMIIATDATPEGVVTALEDRPKMTSIFYRDEIAGLFDAIQRREYLAALPEILTKLYDGGQMTRLLSKKTISVDDPKFIFFGGGILDKTYSLIGEHHFLSGFMPRFLIVTGRADIERVRPTGPPLQLQSGKREALKGVFQELYATYNLDEVMVNVGPTTIPMLPECEVTLTADAWQLFADIEQNLIRTAHDSPHSQRALPSFQRMAFSMLKLAMLFAASRQNTQEVSVEVTDLLNAAYYTQRWGKHFVEFIKNTGQSVDESRLQSVYRTIESHPGINRGNIMSRHHLNKRDMDMIQETLEQRFMIDTIKKGKLVQYWPIGK